MSEATLMIDQRREPAPARAPGALPRLLAGIPAHGAMSLDEHLAVHGQAPASPRRRAARRASRR